MDEQDKKFWQARYKEMTTELLREIEGHQQKLRAQLIERLADEYNEGVEKTLHNLISRHKILKKELASPSRRDYTTLPGTPKRRAEDKVNHPKHYGGGDDPYEAIKVINAWGLNFDLGNTLKYIKRAVTGKEGENPLDDLKKAAWYLNDEIKKHENTQVVMVATLDLGPKKELQTGKLDVSLPVTPEEKEPGKWSVFYNVGDPAVTEEEFKNLDKKILDPLQPGKIGVPDEKGMFESITQDCGLPPKALHGTLPPKLIIRGQGTVTPPPQVKQEALIKDDMGEGTEVLTNEEVKKIEEWYASRHPHVLKQPAQSTENLDPLSD